MPLRTDDREIKELLQHLKQEQRADAGRWALYEAVKFLLTRAEMDGNNDR